MKEMTDTEQKIAAFFIAREGEGVVEALKDRDLVSGGLLDSLDMVGLAVHIEEQFGKKVDLTDPETFAAMRKFDLLVKLAEK